MKFYETREFKKLEKEYLDLIKGLGFDDLEGKDRNAPIRGSRRINEIDTYTEEYFTAARTLLHTLPEGTDEYAIWELHSEGISIRDTVKLLGVSQRKVEATLKKLSKHIKN